jgi:hypothetical protein
MGGGAQATRACFGSEFAVIAQVAGTASFEMLDVCSSAILAKGMGPSRILTIHTTPVSFISCKRTCHMEAFPLVTYLYFNF